MQVRELSVSLCDWEMRAVLESLQRQLQHLKKVCDESDDDDESADAGTDYLALAGLYERLIKDASAVFGTQIADSN